MRGCFATTANLHNWTEKLGTRNQNCSKEKQFLNHTDIHHCTDNTPIDYKYIIRGITCHTRSPSMLADSLCCKLHNLLQSDIVQVTQQRSLLYNYYTAFMQQLPCTRFIYFFLSIQCHVYYYTTITGKGRQTKMGGYENNYKPCVRVLGGGNTSTENNKN